MVVDRAQPEAALAVAPAAFDGEQLLVGGGQVLGGQGEVGGAQQPLAVVVGFACGGGAVDAQQPGLGAPQQPAQPRLVLREPTSSSRRRSGQVSEPSIRPSRCSMRRSRTAASRAAASGLWQMTNRSARAPRVWRRTKLSPFDTHFKIHAGCHKTRCRIGGSDDNYLGKNGLLCRVHSTS